MVTFSPSTPPAISASAPACLTFRISEEKSDWPFLKIWLETTCSFFSLAARSKPSRTFSP